MSLRSCDSLRHFCAASAVLLVLLSMSLPASAQVNKPSAVKQRSLPAEEAATPIPVKKELPSASMLIAGDREAPMVLSIIPWAEPRMPSLTEAPITPLLPKVFNSESGALDESSRRAPAKP